MTSGTTDKSNLENIFSNDVIFPTESLASPNEDTNHNNWEEEEEEIPSLQEQQEQIEDQLINNDSEIKNENNQQGTIKNNDETVDTISEQFLNGEPVNSTDASLLASVVANLEERRDTLMLNGDFRESMKAQKAVDIARTQHLSAIKKQASDEELKNIEKKKLELEQQYEEFQKSMDEQEEKLEEEISNQIQALNDNHQKQIEEHDNNWQNETKLRQYNRASQRLRVLRTQQQLLINAKRYDEAEQVGKIADGVAEQETKESFKQLLTAYKNSRLKLQQKQEDEHDTLMRSCEQKREIFKHQKESLSRPYINRSINLKREEEAAKDPERLWILKYRNDESKRKSYGTTSRSNRSAKTQNQTQNQSKKIAPPAYNKLDLPNLFENGFPPGSPKKRREKTANPKGKP